MGDKSVGWHRVCYVSIIGPIRGAEVSGELRGVNVGAHRESHAMARFGRRLPGRILFGVGVPLAVLALAGCLSVVYRTLPGPGGIGLGPMLSSGVALMMFYGVTLVLGGALAAVGSFMTKAVDKRNRGRAEYVVLAVLLVAGVFIGIDRLSGNEPYGHLLPRFGGCDKVPAVTLDQWVCQ